MEAAARKWGGRERSAVFWTATALIALDTILFTMIVPALPEFAERDGFSDAVAALIFGAYPVAQLIAAVIAAGLVERVGRRPLLIVAPVVLAAATLAFAFAVGPAQLAGARFVQGAAAGLVWTAGLAAISDVYPSDQLGFRIGLAETAGGAVGLLGPVVGGAMIHAVGTTATFALAAILPLLLVVPTFFVRETGTGRGEALPLLPALRKVVIVPRARAAILSLAGLAAVLALLEPLLPLDLDERLGLSPVAIGLVFSAGLLTYFAMVPLAGRWSDRRGRRLPTILGGVVMAVALPLTAVGPAWSVAIGFGVVGAGMAALGASSGALMVEAVDEAGMAGRYGLSSALLTIVFAAGYALGPLVGAATSATLPFLATTIIAGLGALALVAWISRLLPRDDARTAALAHGPKGGEAPR